MLFDIIIGILICGLYVIIIQNNTRLTKHSDLQLVIIKDIDRIDFLKMDIEKSEFDLIMNLGKKEFEKINQMSFEYHCDPTSMVDRLNEFNFNVELIESASEIYAYKE